MTKKAFTLVELLVVVGIMATMATMSIGGYFAIARGMADRGAFAAATSIISIAQERSRIDLVPTAVYFYNEVVQKRDEKNGKEFIAAGVALAVRRAGRISRVNGKLLGDEFSDLEKTYGVADDSGAIRSDTFRLYRFNTRKMEYSSVYSEVREDPVDNEVYLVEKPADRPSFRKENGDEEKSDEMISYAFEIAGGGNPPWQPGDAYAYEFARIRLPDNYIFGTPSDVPTESELVKMLDKHTLGCDPESNGSSLTPVPLSARRPSGWQSIGDTKDEMKDI